MNDFFDNLPQKKVRTPGALAMNDSTGKPYANYRYLVIDDHPRSRESVRHCIQGMGGTQITVSVGYADAINRMKSSRTPFDVIFCDYNLGDGRDGQQLLEELRFLKFMTDATIFLMITAERGYDRVIAVAELIPDDYILKPFVPELLRDRLDKVVAKKRFLNPLFEVAGMGFDLEMKTLLSLVTLPDAKLYRFDLARRRAELFFKYGMFIDAREAYRGVMDSHDLPWAKVGYAKSSNVLGNNAEALRCIEEVVEMAPECFSAYDLKAKVHSDMGDNKSAQEVLDVAAHRNPRNYGRKLKLAELAANNGDTERAKALLKDVVDSGSVVIASDRAGKLAIAKIAAIVGDKAIEKKMRVASGESPEAFDLSERLREEAEISKLTAPKVAAIPSSGMFALDSSREEILEQQMFGRQECISIVTSAIANGDQELADHAAFTSLSSEIARDVFLSLKELYDGAGLESHFKIMQQMAARRRIGSKQE